MIANVQSDLKELTLSLLLSVINHSCKNHEYQNALINDMIIFGMNQKNNWLNSLTYIIKISNTLNFSICIYLKFELILSNNFNQYYCVTNVDFVANHSHTSNSNSKNSNWIKLYFETNKKNDFILFHFRSNHDSSIHNHNRIWWHFQFIELIVAFKNVRISYSIWHQIKWNRELNEKYVVVWLNSIYNDSIAWHDSRIDSHYSHRIVS